MDLSGAVSKISFGIFLFVAVILNVSSANEKNSESQFFISNQKLDIKTKTFYPTNKNSQVVEFFFYGCGHCKNFKPYIDNWTEKRADKVSIIKVPAILDESWTHMARAFYVAHQLGIEKDFSNKMFKAIHENDQKIYIKEQIQEFMLKEFQIDAKSFEKAWNSLRVRANMKLAEKMNQYYSIDATPSIVVINKDKKLTHKLSPRITGSPLNIIVNIELLIR